MQTYWSYFKCPVTKQMRCPVNAYRQQVIYCLEGSVWVTQEGDIHDYVLDEGDAFVITLPGKVLVRAFKPARIGYTENLAAVAFKGRFSQTVFN
jgi:hypothetical protein